MRAAIVALLVAMAATGARAQTPPPDAGELLIPPELRQRPHPELPPAASRTGRHGGHPSKQVARDTAAVPARVHPAPADHPVDFGVVVRGGSATPRVISPLGSSEAVQESGSAVGAGMRFGF